jgi:integrase
MRIGEVLGLRGEYVYDDYIYVCGSYGRYGYGPIKTKVPRSIPLIPEMIGLLKKLMEYNGKGYLFSRDGGATPVTGKYLFDEFHKALGHIGVSRDEIKRRGLTFHSWRHFVNTELQRQGLSLQQVQAVTGHKTESMTKRYSHLDARQIASVTEAQSVISGEKPNLKIVKMPETENIRKWA